MKNTGNTLAPAKSSVAQLLHQGQLHHQQGRRDLAEACYREILDRQPRSIEALHLLGLLALQNGDAAKAVPLLQRAIKINPTDAATQSLLGVALQSSGQSEASITHFERAVRLQPKNAEFHYNLGKALRANDRAAEARNCYQEALRLKQDYPEALNNLSETLISLGQPESALQAAEAALRLQPNYAEAWSNRGAALIALRKLEAALESLNHALDLRPEMHKPLVHRAAVLMDLNRFAEARADFEQALSRDPDDLLLQWNLTTLHLLTGNFAEGWPGYEARWAKGLKGLHPEFRQPAWNGQPTDQRILVWGEQGLGDQILFSSMFAETALRAPAARFAVAPRLLNLYQRSFPALNICTPEEAADDQDFESYVCMGDLCRIFRPDINSFVENRRAYLRADPGRTAELRRTIAKNGGAICGLSWISKNSDVGKEKSILLAEVSQALSGLDFSYVDLQYGDTEAERKTIRAANGIDVLREPTVDTFNDIDGLAALINACDVVVTISNTTAHLAGALGKPVLLMLPHAVGRFWCWQAERSDTLWYPNVRVFRQPVEGDWASVLSEVRAALMDFAKLKS